MSNQNCNPCSQNQNSRHGNGRIPAPASTLDKPNLEQMSSPPSTPTFACYGNQQCCPYCNEYKTHPRCISASSGPSKEPIPNPESGKVDLNVYGVGNTSTIDYENQTGYCTGYAQCGTAPGIIKSEPENSQPPNAYPGNLNPSMCPEVQCDPVYSGKAQMEVSDGAPPCTHEQPGNNVEQQPTDPGIPPKEESRPVPKGVPPPCYYPQPEDSMLAKEDTKDGGMLSRVGAWATGRVDWAPLAGLTGTRPVVDKYSITRYSEGEWRQRNYETLSKAEEEIHRNNLLEYNTNRCIEQTRVEADKNQFDNTKKLGQRAQELHRWKCELERAIAAAADEVSLLEAQRRRLKQASSVLSMPESIAKECLDRRTGRWEPDLVRDEVEEELIKEVALVAEIRDLFNRTLDDIEHQLTEDKTAKQRLEFDWSDKKIAHEIDATNIGLNNRSNIIMFKPGSTRFAFDMSSQQHWEHFTREALEQGEATRQRSLMLRSTLDAILMNAARDLRTQADKVDAALSKKVACTEELRAVLESNLQQVLQRLADTENFKVGLEALIRRLDTSQKIAQTRLDNRLLRPRVEGCRDAPQYGLIDEVKSLSEQVSALKAQMKQTEDSQTALIRARGGLEREIMLKRKALEIDRDRNQLIRSHYPSSAALSGH